MRTKYLSFEKSIEEIERKIIQLENTRKNGPSEVGGEILKLKYQLIEKTKEIFSNLNAWQIVQIARHPERPHTKDYVDKIFDDFFELHGDRISGDDASIIAGIGKFKGITVALAGHQKGRDIKENIQRKFGMAHPEGYRKARRVMKLAEKLHIPVITFIDTPGAQPDIEAEEKGQALTIAENLLEMSLLKVPILCIIIGEGGSGGALAIGVGDRILMQEFSIYSVISPEGCASILWKNQNAVEDAAKSLKLTAKEIYQLGVIDEIIPEPIGGAHSNWEETFKNMEIAIDKNLKELKTIDIDDLVDLRYQKYRKIGAIDEKQED